jgi:hypothetical protein
MRGKERKEDRIWKIGYGRKERKGKEREEGEERKEWEGKKGRGGKEGGGEGLKREGNEKRKKR